MVMGIRIEKEMLVIGIVVIAVIIAQYTAMPVGTEIKSITDNVTATKQVTDKLKETSAIVERSLVIISVPAVDNQGNGVSTILKVEALPGEGKILTNINQLLFWVDTQYSIQTAKAVAENITKMNLSNVDLVYTIETEAQVIEGPSAGAALTLATIAAIESKNVNSSVMITGTINPDGSIGPVGGILAKAKVSKDIGAKLFLVPEGQGLQTSYKPIKRCEKVGAFTYCTVEYERERIDITQQAGIEVKEIGNIQEALKYFLT